MKNIFYILIGFVILSSCQKDITDDVDLNNADPQVVIEAIYTAEDSTVRVKVSYTSSYFEQTASPFYDNATINIIDANGLATTVPNIGSGEYVLSNYVPQFNTYYSIKATIEGVEYSSTCFLQEPVQLDDMEAEFIPGFFGLEGGYVVYMNLQDQPDTLNNYFVVLSRNGVPYSDLTEMFLQDDKFTDGNYVSRPLFGVEFFEVGDTIDMELRSVDQAVYDYYAEIISIAGGGGGAAPANPTSNWDNKALGCFNAYGNSRKSLVIQ